MSPHVERSSRRLQTMAWPWWVVPVAAVAIALFFVSGGLPANRAFVQWGTWALFAYPILWVDRHLPVPADALGRRAAWHVPLSVVWTLAYVLTQLTFSRVVGQPEMGMASLRQSVAQGALHWNILYYWLIVGAHFAVDSAQQARTRKVRAAELERELVQAQLSTLRAQLQPHFLFNALNLIAAEVERDPATARTMIAHLGQLLRATLHLGGREEVPLHEEVALLDHYLAIQRARFAGRLRIEVHIAPAALDVLVPPLLLQPLVENAMHHGLAQTIRPGFLRIAADVSNRRLRITVEDNGAGLPPGWQSGVHEGTGLTNTRQRLTTRYGDDHRVEVRAADDGGVVTSIDMPASAGSKTTDGTAA